MLPTDKALELYGVLKPHLPEMVEGSEFLDYIENIIKNMSENDPASYVYCLQLLSGLELNDFEGMEPLEAFNIFLEGLMENKIIRLVEFCETLGL